MPAAAPPIDPSAPHALPVLAAWLNTLTEPHVLFDQQYRILAANDAYQREFGQGAAVLGRPEQEVGVGNKRERTFAEAEKVEVEPDRRAIAGSSICHVT